MPEPQQPQQPQDEWVYLRPEEYADEEEIEAVDRAAGRPPEESAMHVERLAGRRRRHRVDDPGRADVSTGAPTDDDGMPVDYFEDEEPERPSPPSRTDDREPDLEDMLESQHYSFEPDDGANEG